MSINCTAAPVNADNNDLFGTIPSQIGNLTELRVFEGTYISTDVQSPEALYVCSDGILLPNTSSVDHNALTGTIPMELGYLINIVELDLDDNKLTGTVPTKFGTMINARELDLGKLEDYTLEELYLLLKSNLPCFGNLSHTSFPLDFCTTVHNQLSGPIPTEIGNLLSLTMLELNNNIMTGTLPTQLGQLTKLEQLKLAKNVFTGFIPTEIGLMASLSSIDLRGNSLTGPIPSEIGLITHLTEIRLEGNNFTGTIPVEVASLERLKVLTFDNSLTGNRLSRKN